MIFQCLSNNTELLRLPHHIRAVIKKILNLEISSLIKLRLFIKTLNHLLLTARWSLSGGVMDAELTVPIYFAHVLTHTG